MCQRSFSFFPYFFGPSPILSRIGNATALFLFLVFFGRHATPLAGKWVLVPIDISVDVCVCISLLCLPMDPR